MALFLVVIKGFFKGLPFLGHILGNLVCNLFSLSLEVSIHFSSLFCFPVFLILILRFVSKLFLLIVLLLITVISISLLFIISSCSCCSGRIFFSSYSLAFLLLLTRTVNIWVHWMEIITDKFKFMFLFPIGSLVKRTSSPNLRRVIG